MNQDDNRSYFSYLLECTAACLHSPTSEYIKASSLIYMRHGLLTTDAGVILPTHNYTHQQHLFCMDDSQLQIHIFPLCLCCDTETTNSAQIPSSSFWHRNNLSDWKTPLTISCFILMSLFFFFNLLQCVACAHIHHILSLVLLFTLEKWRGPTFIPPGL